jgi:hypothetical protein
MPSTRIHVGDDEALLDGSLRYVVQSPQASMPELMCGWGCHMGFPEASED